MRNIAWKRQRELQKKYSLHDIPGLEEIENIISGIKIGKVDTDFQSKRAKALFAMYYLTAGRASEILKTPYLKRRRYKKNIVYEDGTKKVIYDLDENNNPIIERWIQPHTFLGTMKCDIKEKEFYGNRHLEIRIENRKNKERHTKLLPIPIEKEYNIAKYILDYIKDMDDKQILFNFGKRRAEQIINQTTGFNIHFIRHIRATHMISIYDFNEQMYVKFMGWADIRPARKYLELKSSDIAREFYKK